MIVTVGIAELPAGKPFPIRVSETLTVAVCELDGVYHAFDDKCPHRGHSLSGGQVTGDLVVCPAHHFKFSLKNAGRCVMPRHLKLRSFPVSREGDQLSIDVKDAAEPAAADMVLAGTRGPAG